MTLNSFSSMPVTRHIDSHAHMGLFVDDGTGKAAVRDYTPQDIANFVSPKNNPSLRPIEKIIVSNLSCIGSPKGQKKPFMDEYQGNIDTYERCKQFTPLAPAAVAQPGIGNADNLKKLFDKPELYGKFHAIKFHPEHLKLDADHPAYDPYLKLAKQYNLPCVFHTAPGFSAPEKVYNLAKRHPEVPIVLYHMNLQPGSFVKDLPEPEIKMRQLESHRDKHCWDVREYWNKDAIQCVKDSLSKKDANLYLETSWAKPSAIIDAIKAVGSDKVLWGTDAPFKEIKDSKEVPYHANVNETQRLIYKNFHKNAEEISDNLFFKNGSRLFLIKL